MAVTLKDLAEQLGLSVSTVSRVMNGKGHFPEKTKRKVTEAAERLGYTPNVYARCLREREYRVIGLIVPDVINPFFGTILQAVEDECRNNGYTLLSGVSGFSEEREAEYIDFFASNQVIGVILVSHDSENEIADMHRRGMRVVSLNEHSEKEEIDWVSIDNFQAMQELTQFLINQGHREIACLYGLDEFLISETESRRLEGYRSCMQKNHLELKDELIIGTYENYEEAKENAKKLLCLPKRPTAIVCHNNEVAAGVYKAMTDAGLRVPEDVSIACFDSILPENLVGIQFTCILQPLEDICREAINLLTGEDLEPSDIRPRKRVTLPYRLQLGKTTAPIVK